MFPIHFLLRLIFILGDYISISANMDMLRIILRHLQGVFGPFAFVYISSKTAPYYKKVVSILIGLIIIVIVPLSMPWFNAKSIGITFHYSVL
jgi:hypothetical protein